MRFAASLPLVAFSYVLASSPQGRAGLIHHWGFDESSGSSASDGVGGNTGSWVPGIDATPDWKPADGLFGGAIELPGNGNHRNYFATSGFPALNGTPAGMTVSVWVKPARDSGYRGILMTRTVSDDVGGGRNYGLAHDDNGADGRVSASSVDSANGSLVANGNWIHVVWAWDNSGGTQKVYINGVQSGPTENVSIRTITSNGQWRIGDDACCNDRNFDGLVDDLAVWDEPLAADDVAEIHANGLAGYGVGESPPPPTTDPLEVGVVINEVHHDAEPKTEFVEFIEILNTNSTPVDLGGWSFSDGVSFNFPAGTTLDATSYLILAENPAELATKFPLIPSGTQVFTFMGALSNDGEPLVLRDATTAVVDRVDYRAEFPWPISPNGEGDSMQLINATLDNDLGGAWRGAPPTPGLPNAVFATDAPPLIRQVDHSPKSPTSAEMTSITAKVTDPDGVASVDLLYQVVTPGAFVPAYLPNSYSTLTGSPNTQQSPNPAFENPANWTTVSMLDDGTGSDVLASDGIYTVQLPAQAHRTLVRYRIVAEDTAGESIRVPYADDASLNFAFFVYDGVPDYVVGGTTYGAAMLTELPVYHMITRDADRRQAFAYSSTGDGGWQIPKGNVAARKVYNWECVLVYDGVVYDHVGWRLRQRNDRYAGNGKRSMRFRMNRGHYFQARGEDGKKLPVKWRRFNTSKMSRFGGTNSYGLHETINSKLWRMVGVEAPYFLPAHWRMIDAVAEAPDQYGGDFFGFTTVMQDIDGRLLDERGLPNGNMYKLKDGVTDPLELQRNQSRTAVSDGSDFQTIKDDLDSSQSDAWLRDHVDWDQWARYHAVVEAVRHYDYGTPSTHFKNRAWYFMEKAGTAQGLLRVIPHDHDASWAPGYHDNLNSTGNSIGTGFPWAAVFDDITRPPSGTEKGDFTRDYRNFIREFRQLLWQEETVDAVVDDYVAKIEPFTLADQARWTGGAAAVGVEQMTGIANVATPMKNMAFVSDTMYGSNLVGGRGAFLDQIATDATIPDKPVISYTGTEGYPAGGLQFTSSAFADPQGAGTYALTQWRIAEVAPAPDRKFEWDAEWVAEGTGATVTPPAVATRAGGNYRARVRHQDDTGRWGEWSEAHEFVATQPDISLFTSSLVISEIMYHPSDPTPAEITAGYTDDDFFEYIEVRNVGTQTIDLTDVRFTKGVDFDFAGSAGTTLAPGEFVLVVENAAAFDMRYGAGKPVAGQWSNKLDNGGEQLKLSFGAGEAIRDFVYDDMPDWPTSPDGGGTGLVLVDPYGLPDHGDPFSWRAAAPNPGTSDSTVFPGGDDAALLAYATGGIAPSIAVLPGGEVTLAVGENRLAEDLNTFIEVSTDLVKWALAGTAMPRTAVAGGAGGIALVTYTTTAAPGELRWFVRQRVELR